jgi:hypothetical protein
VCGDWFGVVGCVVCGVRFTRNVKIGREVVDRMCFCGLN